MIKDFFPLLRQLKYSAELPDIKAGPFIHAKEYKGELIMASTHIVEDRYINGICVEAPVIDSFLRQ